MAPETSFVLKRGEGLHDGSMIQHKVLDTETPRSSSAGSTPKIAPPGPKSSYISPMHRARLAKKRREGGRHSKDWDVDSSTGSETQSSVSTPSPLKPLPVAHSGNLLVSKSGNLVPNSGYIPKERNQTGPDGDSKHLPKFGVWDNQNNASEPCYTLLFENIAQEKRTGGPIRVHANRSASPAPNEDLYNYNVPGSIKSRKNKTQFHHSLLCCFVGS